MVGKIKSICIVLEENVVLKYYYFEIKDRIFFF